MIRMRLLLNCLRIMHTSMPYAATAVSRISEAADPCVRQATLHKRFRDRRPGSPAQPSLACRRNHPAASAWAAQSGQQPVYRPIFATGFIISSPLGDQGRFATGVYHKSSDPRRLPVPVEHRDGCFSAPGIPKRRDADFGRCDSSLAIWHRHFNAIVHIRPGYLALLRHPDHRYHLVPADVG